MAVQLTDITREDLRQDSSPLNIENIYRWESLVGANSSATVVVFSDSEEAVTNIGHVLPMAAEASGLLFGSTVNWAVINPLEEPSTQKLFDCLADEWRMKTRSMSSINDIVMHEAYQKIIGMGESAIPFILRALQNDRNHWFPALMSISRQSPVPPEHDGDIERMTAAWLDWGRLNGYI